MCLYLRMNQKKLHLFSLIWISEFWCKRKSAIFQSNLLLQMDSSRWRPWFREINPLLWLEFLDVQETHASVKVRYSSLKSSFTSVERLVKTSMKKIKPVVTYKLGFDHGVASYFRKTQTIKILMQDSNQMKFQTDSPTTSKELAIEILTDEIKPAVT